MLVYVDAAVMARAYLPDEPGHAAAAAVLTDGSLSRVTGTLTRIEVTAALTRRAKSGQLPDLKAALRLLANDLGPDGCVTEIVTDQREVEAVALALVRQHGLRTLDAMHLAAATNTLELLAARGEQTGLASTDQEQRRAAKQLGFAVIPGPASS